MTIRRITATPPEVRKEQMEAVIAAVAQLKRACRAAKMPAPDAFVYTDEGRYLDARYHLESARSFEGMAAQVGAIYRGGRSGVRTTICGIPVAIAREDNLK